MLLELASADKRKQKQDKDEKMSDAGVGNVRPH
jgi:hypothetical protein